MIFYLVPTRLLEPTRLLNSKKLSRLPAYLAVTLIRQLRVVRLTTQTGWRKSMPVALASSTSSILLEETRPS